MLAKTLFKLSFLLLLPTCSPGLKPVPLDSVPIGKPTTEHQINECKKIIGNPEIQKYFLPHTHPASLVTMGLVERLVATSGNTGKRIGVVIVNAPQIPNAGINSSDCLIVFSGILPLVKSEDEYAFVIAHELAHVMADHAAQKENTSIGSSSVKFLSTLFGVMADASLAVVSRGAYSYSGAGDAGTKYMSAVGEGLTTLRYSREMELEADRIALYLMAKASYDPRAVKSLLERQDATKTSGTPTFFSTHPDTAGRLSNCEHYLPSALTMYELAPKKPYIHQLLQKAIAKKRTLPPR